eukprot:1217984-Alexandrium_andersonii.AAC.1
MCIRDRPKIQPEGAVVPARPTGQNGPRRGSESANVGDPSCRIARRKRRRAKRGASCAWTFGMG